MDEFELPMSHTYGGWKELCGAPKFHIQANKELLGAKHIKFHKIKLFTRYIKLWKSKKKPKIYWAINFINRSYVSNHIIILLSNIYLTYSRIFLFQFLSRISILPSHPITQPDSTISAHYRLDWDYSVISLAQIWLCSGLYIFCTMVTKL